ncbi:hypothetical protein Hdeb2414_s0007g00228741 [Helianthus debilis subsp. tardiflorus]
MNDSTMSWLDLNYVFGELSSNNTSTFIGESSVEGHVVPNSYDGRVNDDHAEEVVFDFRSHDKESLLPDLNVVIVPKGDYGYGCPDYEAGYDASNEQEDYGNNFLVSDTYVYIKTLVSLLTSKSHWVATTPLTLKFRSKLIRYE